MAKDETGAVYDNDGTPYNYIVIIDAGSSGSRVHVYSYPDTSYGKTRRGLLDEDEADEPEYGKADERISKEGDTNGVLPLPAINKQGFKWVKKTKPGMSSFASKADDVGKKHLKKLLKYAEKVVPTSQHSRTPLFVHATGGMRLLVDEGKDTKLLQKSCDYIRSKTDFFVPDCGTHVNIISGDMEGIFGWLAVNYLIGGLQHPEQHDHGKGHSTYGFLEMGGASTQVTFVPNATEIEEHQSDLYSVKLATLPGYDRADEPLRFQVSSTTFLGMGVNEVQKKVFESLGKSKENPCDPKGLIANYDKNGFRLVNRDEEDDSDDEDDDHHKLKTVTTTKGTGDYVKCQALLKPLVQDVKSTVGPDFDFDVNHFIGVSEYWDTAHDGFQMGGRFDTGKLEEKVKVFCETPWTELKKSHKNSGENGGRKLSLGEMQDLCIRASWILNMVDNGLGLPSSVSLKEGKHLDDVGHDESLDQYLNPLQSVSEINGSKYSWTLGRAILYASSEQGVGGNAGIRMKSTDHSSSLFLFGNNNARPAFNPSSKEVTHKGHDDDNDNDDGYDWDDMFEHRSNRLWGSLLFLLILVVIVYLLLGKVRRAQIWQNIKTKMSGLAGDSLQNRFNKYRAVRGGEEGGSGGNEQGSSTGGHGDLELGIVGNRKDDDNDAFSVSSDSDH